MNSVDGSLTTKWPVIFKGIMLTALAGTVLTIGLNYRLGVHSSSPDLPFLTMPNGPLNRGDESLDRHLHKIDFWMDSFVPYEQFSSISFQLHGRKRYGHGRRTSSSAAYRIKKSIGTYPNASEGLSSNEIPQDNGKTVKKTTPGNVTTEPPTTTTTTTTTTTLPVEEPPMPTTTTTQQQPSSNLSELESTVAVLRKKIEFLQRKTTLDPKLLYALNQTLSNPNSENTILSLLIQVVKQLEESDSSTESGIINARTIIPEVDPKTFISPELCKNIKDYSIFPNDSKKVILEKQASLMRCYMNVSSDPCMDFYEYACGNWHRHHVIPRDRGSWDIFEILREDLDMKLVQILGQEPTGADNNATKAIKTLYSSCMNTETIERLGTAPLLELLEDFGGWPVLDPNWNSDNSFDWIETISQLRQYNNDILVAVWIGPDGERSENNIVQFDQSDLHLPSFEYYKLGIIHPIIQTYYKFLVDVALLLGAQRDVAKAEMMDLIHFEIELANIMIPPHQRRNFSEMYQKMTLGELSQAVPNFNFSAYLKDLFPRPLDLSEDVVMYSLPYMKKLTDIVEKTNKRTVANYILWRFIRHRINNLDSRFQKVQKDIYLKLSGRVETPPRWKYCVAYVNGNLGYAVGSAFVKKYFDRQSKKDMELLTNDVQTIFRKLVQNGEWLTNSTKKLADDKIKEILHNIGYPDFILNDDLLQEEVEGLNYNNDGFFENVLSNLRSRTVKEMKNFGEKVNRTVWTITPAVVNAFYSRNKNQIMFPAGILQPPFYHKHFPKSMNFGGIGVVIGHEITHGFDDKGRQFDQFGNIRVWWDHTSSKNFQRKAKCFVDQYSSYLVSEVGIYLNGWNTQGENIADNGGLKESYLAFKNRERLDGEEKVLLPGFESFTQDQLFFLNFAQVWCGSSRLESLRNKLRSAVHAPGNFRVKGTLANSQEFSRAFACPNNAEMNPDAKCSVW